MNEALKQFGIVFPAGDQSPVAEQPTDAAFDFVASFETSQRTAVLNWRPLPVAAMRTAGWLFDMQIPRPEFLNAEQYLELLVDVWAKTQRTIKGQLNE